MTALGSKFVLYSYMDLSEQVTTKSLIRSKELQDMKPPFLVLDGLVSGSQFFSP